jgi:hypothetical protein
MESMCRTTGKIGLEEDIEHGFGSHAHTKGCGIATVTQDQPIIDLIYLI